ncbi:NUDIX domain-containing protein [Sphingomonas nostoxanthinifaciens]|uniref:NUDIX domain-containing protein n=1 Tax=Sphingomonas nostoxanthinifaciens TaxID=2872652 RepID=UPI001CC207B3|nr:NUDIX domain-containing protein [Sphingomonas nostoxanthinifaciens]UAK22958.1 NUDIX domain-containing protein [Sphingomonas nostoxanthinifaciens]
MAAPRSAGVLLYRRTGAVPEVLLVLPGGPFWRGRDVGAWQIPKGAIEPGETPLAAAIREVGEELGVTLTDVPRPLAQVRQAGGKWVEAFTLEQDVDPDAVVSITFELEWPPRSGRMRSFPEVAAARWFTLDAARRMILLSQAPLVEAIAQILH